MTTQEVTNSLQIFKERRDDLMHEDINGFDHFVKRLLDFCENDSLMKNILNPLKADFENVDANNWWETGKQNYQVPDFPENQDEELILRYKILERIRGNKAAIYEFGRMVNSSKVNE